MRNIQLDDKKEIAYAVKHIGESDLKFHGSVFTDLWRDGKYLEYEFPQGKNTFTTTGMNLVLGVVFKSDDEPSAIYCGIFKNNVTPAAADTSAKLGSGNAYGECQDADYDSPATNRPAYTVATPGSAICTNAASKAEFTIAATITVYGSFLSDQQAKTSVAATLICAKKFAASRAVIDNDVLAVTYIITCTTS